jgi:putative lipoprotein
MRWTLAHVSGLLWMASAAIGCSGMATPTPVPALDDAALANGRYCLSLLSGDSIALTEGAHTLASGESAASLAIDMLAVPRGRGDINGDGAEDVAVVLRVTSAGETPAFELVLLLNRAGQPQQAASAALGPGIDVRGVTIDRGQIEVTLLSHPPAGTSAAPAAAQIRTFVYEGEALVEAPPTDMAMSSVTGTLNYREDLALPAQAVITVQLVDVSQADAPATLISEQSFTSDGQQVPFPFTLAFDPETIEARNTYVVQAEIIVEGEVLFRTTRQHRVITQGNPLTIDIYLQRIA